MIRLFIGVIALFGFGVIFAEVLNNSKLFDFEFQVYAVAGLMSLVFLCIKLALKTYRRKASFSIESKKKYHHILNVYHIILGLILFFGLVILPFLWWGVIMKLARMANSGNPDALIK